MEIAKRLLLLYPEGPLFRNADGNPWTPYAVNCAFGRLQISFGKERMTQLGVKADEEDVKKFALGLKKEVTEKGKTRAKTQSELLAEARRKLTYKLAREHGAKCCLYVFRHSWCTRALESGLDVLTVSVLMGHKDPTMVSRVYSHLSKWPEFLQQQAKKVTH